MTEALADRQDSAARRFAWHPVAFAAAFVLTLWVDAAISPLAAARSLALAVAGAGLVYLILALVVRDARRAALGTSLLIALLVSKSAVLTLLALMDRMDGWEAWLWLALVGAAVLLAGRIAFRSARRWTLAGTTYGLNVLSIAMIVVTAASALTMGRIEMAARDLDQGRTLSASSTATADLTLADADPRRNIYLLLLDGYPRADILEEIFDYDNSRFLEGLNELGFDVASASSSEYLWTEHTLVSMLHRDYLERIDAIQPALGAGAPTQPTIRNLLNENPTFADVRAARYEIVSVPTAVEGTAIRRADVLVDQGRLNEFEFKLLTTTFVGDIVNVVAPAFGADQHRGRILDGLAALRTIAADDSAGPRFVWAHLLTPHWPAAWTADGGEVNVPLSPTFLNNLLSQQTIPRDEFIASFRGHLEFTNHLVLEAVAGVVEEDPQAIVIVMSDHGSWVGFEGPHGEPDWDLRERTGILFAARTPGQSAVFPDDISPVNVFRYLLDAYLDTDLGTVRPLPGGRQVDVLEP